MITNKQILHIFDRLSVDMLESLNTSFQTFWAKIEQEKSNGECM